MRERGGKPDKGSDGERAMGREVEETQWMKRENAERRGVMRKKGERKAMRETDLLMQIPCILIRG